MEAGDWLPYSSPEALFLSYLFTLLLSANPVERLCERHEFPGRSGDFSAQHLREAPLEGALTQRLEHEAVLSAVAASLFNLRAPSIEEEKSSVRQEGQADHSNSVRIWVLFGWLGFMSGFLSVKFRRGIRWWGSSPTCLEVFVSHLFSSVLNTAF